MNELGILPFPLPITILDKIPTIPIVNLLAKRNNAFGLARDQNLVKEFLAHFLWSKITLS